MATAKSNVIPVYRACVPLEHGRYTSNNPPQSGFSFPAGTSLSGLYRTTVVQVGVWTLSSSLNPSGDGDAAAHSQTPYTVYALSIRPRISESWPPGINAHKHLTSPGRRQSPSLSSQTTPATQNFLYTSYSDITFTVPQLANSTTWPAKSSMMGPLSLP